MVYNGSGGATVTRIEPSFTCRLHTLFGMVHGVIALLSKCGLPYINWSVKLMGCVGAEGVMLRIDLRSLEAGYHEISLAPAPADVGLEPNAFRNILVEVGLDYDGKKAFVSVKASAVALLICDRTLTKFEQSIKGEYSLLFSPNEEEKAEDEIRSISSTDEELDITDIVRDTLLLAIPVRKIAPGADEAEIPVAFGTPADTDYDPRWEALKALKHENSGD